MPAAAGPAGPAGPPALTDAGLPALLAERGVPGLVDLHTHFMPANVLAKVWAFFDEAGARTGRPWPITYRTDEAERLATLRSLGVTAFAPLAYPHRPGMARWLNEWLREFAARTPDAVPTATFYPEIDAPQYVEEAIEAGLRCVKVHVQVGGFDPRDPLLDDVWGLLAQAGVPVVTHCGDGPNRGAYTGLGIFEEVLARHPDLVAVLAHAGLPDYVAALDLVHRYPGVHLDTTMVGTAFTQAFAPLPADWPARLVDVADRVVLGTDFPNIPHPYAEQVAAVVGWADADPRLGDPFLRAVLHDTGARLLGR
ncbi:amidohydrolase family protein [Kineosporia sp. A_224]|uniref:amidohydrolase family protein n=1 Tax=Kineosporia sp. A_224 TaxID=1962180 RepID=UPI000B4A6BA2|nr:amidohydrolase family protein [Kineosporia sp. A_224]